MSHNRYEALKRRLPFEVVPTNLEGAFTSPAWTDDFDLETATPAELIKHGVFWRRPKSEDDPRLIEAWQEAVRLSRKLRERFVPVLEPQIGRTHLRGPIRRADDGTYTGGAWSGGALPGNWSGVIGQWQIPTVTQPPEPAGINGGWTSSSWVGIDGAYSSNDVLQAGVQQQVDAYGNASYVAWYEWFTPPTAGSPGYIWQTNIPNFPVSPGDTVFCSVQYLGSSAGYLYFYNSTSGVSPFSITLAPPPGATFDGESAEWIMECNDYGEYGGESLPAFTPINFTGCIACSQTTPSSTPLNGDTFIILTPQGQPLTDTVLGDGTVEITFIG